MADDHFDHPYAALHLSNDVDDAATDEFSEESSNNSSPLKSFQDSPRKVLVHENSSAVMDIMDVLALSDLDSQDFSATTGNNTDGDTKNDPSLIKEASDNDARKVNGVTENNHKVDKNVIDEVDGVPSELVEAVPNGNLNGNDKPVEKDMLVEAEPEPKSNQSEDDITNDCSEKMEEDEHVSDKEKNEHIESKAEISKEQCKETEESAVESKETKSTDENSGPDTLTVEKSKENLDAELDKNEADLDNSAYKSGDETDNADESISMEANDGDFGDGDLAVSTSEKGSLVLSISRKHGRKRKRRRSFFTSKPSPNKIAKLSVSEANSTAGVESETVAKTDDNEVGINTDAGDAGTSTADLEMATG